LQVLKYLQVGQVVDQAFQQLALGDCVWQLVRMVDQGAIRLQPLGGQWLLVAAQVASQEALRLQVLGRLQDQVVDPVALQLLALGDFQLLQGLVVDQVEIRSLLLALGGPWVLQVGLMSQEALGLQVL